MEISLYLSIEAIIIACISLFWSIYLGYRDRGNIKATSKISYNGPNSKYFYLQIKAVNCSRRPVVLSMFGKDYSNGAWEGSYIEEKEGRLAENEKYEITIRAGDSDTMSPDGEEAVNFWFEDTLGRRYKVKNAKENLKKLWKKN